MITTQDLLQSVRQLKDKSQEARRQDKFLTPKEMGVLIDMEIELLNLEHTLCIKEMTTTHPVEINQKTYIPISCMDNPEAGTRVVVCKDVQWDAAHAGNLLAKVGTKGRIKEVSYDGSTFNIRLLVLLDNGLLVKAPQDRFAYDDQWDSSAYYDQ